MATNIFQIVLLLSICILCSTSVESKYPTVFNFGDSNSDTGNLVAGIGYKFDPPYGHTYFGRPEGRACDGRLIVDFLMDAMDLPFLNPYLDSIGLPNLHTGCNFAAAGATIEPATADIACPFSFGIQVAQFLRFKARVLDLLSQSKKLDEYIPAEEYFYKGLYMFDIGQLGCLQTHNLAAKVFNQRLRSLCHQLQGEYPDIYITYVDIFSIKSNLIRNYSQYGFEEPIMVCCGYGGPPLNCDSRFQCGNTVVLNRTSVTAKGCSDSTKYVSWDGTHYTEAANQHVAEQILTGKYTILPFFNMSPFHVAPEAKDTI